MTQRWKSTRAEKVLFLSKHPELWEKPEAVIRDYLIQAGLVSAFTNLADLRVKALVEDARDQAGGKKP